jgi:hypothetical protein
MIEIDGRELAAVIATAAALSKVAATHKDELAEELASIPRDEITQWEIEALYGLETAGNALALSFRRRLAAGATVESGEYSIKAEQYATLEDAEQEAGPANFNMLGMQVDRQETDNAATAEELEA